MSVTEPKIKLSYVELLGFEMALKNLSEILCKSAQQPLIFNLAHIKTAKPALSEVDYHIEDCPSLLVNRLSVSTNHTYFH